MMYRAFIINISLRTNFNDLAPPACGKAIMQNATKIKKCSFFADATPPSPDSSNSRMFSSVLFNYPRPECAKTGKKLHRASLKKSSTLDEMFLYTLASKSGFHHITAMCNNNNNSFKVWRLLPKMVFV